MKKASVFQNVLKKRLCLAGLIVGIAAAVAAVLFVSDAAARAAVVSLGIVCVMLTLPKLLHATPVRKKPKKRGASLDAYRLMPQDKGRIIPFPEKKNRK